MKISTFREGLFDPLFEAFKQAFSDYSVPFQLSREAFSVRINDKLHLNHDLSQVAMIGDQMAGFILQSRNSYEGIDTIYNGGTGVIPSERRNKIAQSLFEHLLPDMQNSGAKRSILEVITTNKRAISLYESLGYRPKQLLHCFKGLVEENLSPRIKEVQGFPTRDQVRLLKFLPTFFDSPQQLKYNTANETCLELRDEQRLVGFVIFQSHLGRVSQLAFDSVQTAAQLLSAAQKISASEVSIMNIPGDAIEYLDVLDQLGLENQVDQFEMELVF